MLQLGDEQLGLDGLDGLDNVEYELHDSCDWLVQDSDSDEQLTLDALCDEQDRLVDEQLWLEQDSDVVDVNDVLEQLWLEHDGLLQLSDVDEQL